MKRCASLWIFLFLLCAGYSAGQDSEIRSETTVDWISGEIHIELFIPIEKPLHSSQSARTATEEIARRNIDSIFYREMFPLIFNSATTIRDQAVRVPKFLGGLAEIGRRGRKSATRLSTDLSAAIITYSYSMNPDLISIFIEHESTYLPEPPIGFFPASSYTGLVIYAKGAYPVHGEDETGQLAAALFPRIYDTDMNLIVDSEMIDPEFLSFWGVVRYAEGEDFLLESDRIGTYPLVTMAREIFGTNRCDVIIPTDVGLKLLADERNRRLITQGRVVIICDFP